MIDACADVARYMRLGVEVPSWPARGIVVAGVHRGCAVRLEVRLPGLTDWGPLVPATLTVDNRRPIQGLVLRRRMGGFATDDNIQSGDPAFDKHVRFSAEDLGAARAVLHTDTRMLLARIVGSGRCTVDGGVITWHRKVRTDAQELLHMLQRGVQIARRLSRPSDTVDRLAHLAWSKDPPSLRRFAVRALGEHADSNIAARAALHRIVTRASPGMMLDAIRSLGPSQIGRAAALARSGAVADHTRAAARLLVCQLDPDAAASLVAAVVAERAPPLTRTAAIEQAAELGLRETWPALSTLCADAQYVGAASRALAELVAVEAEGDLLHLLSAGPEDCRPALIATLRTLGSAACVPALTELTENAGASPRLRRAAERALTDIHQRLAEPAAGATPVPGVGG